MKQLTEYQKKFILNTFFLTEKYAGWKGVAEKLLEKGSCTVAGDKCIWNGGIGNFIYTSDAVDAVGCLLYTFNLEKFLSSNWYISIADGYLDDLYAAKIRAEKEYNEILDIKGVAHHV